MKKSHKQKFDVFEYILLELTSWYIDNDNDWDDNDFNELKISNMLFFVSVVNADEDDSLINLFDFEAYPYGPKDYSMQGEYILNDRFTIDRKCCKYNKDVNDLRISNVMEKLQWDLACSVIKSIDKLKEININLINLPPGRLVDIAQTNASWKHQYHHATSHLKTYKDVMLPEHILNNTYCNYNLDNTYCNYNLD